MAKKKNVHTYGEDLQKSGKLKTYGETQAEESEKKQQQQRVKEIYSNAFSKSKKKKAQEALDSFYTNLRKKREEKEQKEQGIEKGEVSPRTEFKTFRREKLAAEPTVKKEPVKKTELQSVMESAGMKPKSATEPKKDTTITTTPKANNMKQDFRDWQIQADKDIKAGVYDNSPDATWKSDKGLREARNKYATEINDTHKKIDELKQEKEEAAAWYPDIAMEDYDSIYSDLESGAYSQGEDLLAYKGISRESAANRAKNYYNRFKESGAIREGDEAAQQNARERAFNSVFDYDENGDAYELITEGMTPEEKAVLDDKLDGIIEGMTNPYSGIDYDKEITDLENNITKLTGNLNKSKQEEADREKLNQLIANAPEVDDSQWTGERKYLTEGKTPMQMLVNSITGAQGEDETDKAFWEIQEAKTKWGNMTTAERIALLAKLDGQDKDAQDTLSTSLTDTAEGYGRYYAFMLPEQMDAFEKYYKAGMKEEAKALLDGLSGYLNQCRKIYTEQMQTENAQGKYGAVYGLSTLLEAPQAGAMGTIGTELALAGNEDAGDKNSIWYLAQNNIGTIRQERAEQWGETAKKYLGEWAEKPAEFLNGVFYSMGDMAVATGIGSGMGVSENVNQALVQFVMSSEAASATMNEQLEEGKDPTEAALYAIGSGTIEWITEKYSLEQLLDPNVREMLGNKAQLAKFIAKNFAAEASEEAAGKVLEVGLDAVLSAAYGHENELLTRYRELTDSGMDPTNATGQVLWELTQEIGTEALAGGVSGLFMASARVAINSASQKSTGKVIKNAETSKASGQDVMINAGLSMAEDTQSHKIAQEMQEKAEAGKEISARDLGRLAQNIQYESNENAAKAAETVVEDKAYEKLAEAGMEDGERREMAQIMAKAVVNGGVDYLSKEEKHRLLTNNEAFNAYKDFMFASETSREVMGKIMDATQKEANAQASVSELLDERRGQATRQAEDAGEQLASEEDIRNASGTKVEGGRGVIVNGQWAKLGNLVTVKEKDANGNTKTSLKWQVITDSGEKTVSASEIRAADFVTANIMRQAAVNPQMFSNGFVNTLMQANDNGEIKNVGRYLLEAQKIRMAGYLRMQMPANTMGSKAAQEIYNQAQYEHEKNREAQINDANRGENKPVTFMGAEYGTEEYNQAISKIKNANQRAQIDYIAGIAQRAGIEVHFRDAAEVEKEYEKLYGEKPKDAAKIYGWESGKNGISVNVEGLDFVLGEDGKAVAKGNHNMVVTFGHEMTHWLQRNSLQGYNQLESFVMSEMRRNGVNVSQRVMEVMAKRGLNIEDAMSEIVADSCDQILANEEVAQHIQETNKGLFKEIKGFVKDLVGRVRNAIKGMDESKSRDARAMMYSANRLAKIWLGAYDEAISGEIRRGEATDTTRLSEADFSYETLIKKPDMVVYTLNELSDKEYQEDLSKNTRDFAKDIIEEVKQENDGKPEIYNKDTGKSIQITVESIKHSIGRELQKNYALICHNMTKILENAVAVNELNGRQPKSNYSTLLIGAYNTKDAFTTVRFNVNNRTWKADSFEILYSIAKNDIKKEGPVNMTPGLQAQVPDSGSPSFKISIAELLDIVKNAEDIAAVVSKDVADTLGIKRKFVKGLSEDLRYSQAELDSEYDQAIKSGDVQRQQELVNQAADKAGYTIRAYHGTGRADRVGTVFRADRATSGPMAFFTDNRDIAENYSKDKDDTSIAYDEEYGDYYNQFRIKLKNGKEVPVGKLWNTLTFAERQKITEAAKHITLDDEAEEIIWDENAQHGIGNFSDYERKLHGWNSIDTLIDGWLEGGTLWQREGDFLKVLEMAGIKGVKWNNPNYREEKVYDTYLKIQNPFDTGEMYNVDFLENLSDWWNKQDQEKYTKETANTDLWDKNNITVRDWIENGWREMKNGGATYNWTRIPDGVTAYLKEQGYDGIKDQGGKGGGAGHTVWIPFSSEQIKSAEPVTYDDNGNVIPLSERFNPEKVDIRWSQAEVDQKQEELRQAYLSARDVVDDLRQRHDQMKPEMDAWVEKITEAQKAGKMDETLEEYKEWEKGYTKLRDDLYNAEQNYKQANKAYEDYIEQRDVAEEQKKIQASGLSEPEYRRKQAIDQFGYTTDFREAGYMLPNGRMLNFTGEKGKHYGMRGEDHRGIGIIYASSEYQGGAAMMAFMRDGNIRVMAETPGVDIVASKEPTTEQYAAIRNMARRFAGEEYFNVDFTDDRGYNVDSIEYDGRVNPERIVNDIKTFYRTGAAPQQSVVSQFHYSKADLENLDAGAWIGSLTPGQVQTEAERSLINAYKGKRVSIQLSIKKQLDYKAKIKQLTDNLEKLTPAQLDDLKTLQDKLAAEQVKHAQLEDELFQITSADGYAGLMYRQNTILNNFILGKTQDQVRQTVDEMVKETQKAKDQIAKQAEELKKLAQTQAVQTMKSYLQKTSLSFAAKSLKKELNSGMNLKEVENRLAEMALKKANGESIEEDARLLATDMTNQMRGYQLDVMERMRGVTITIGPDEQAEMKGNGMTLQSVREQLKGTGIKVKYGDYSSLDTDTQEGGDLRVLLPEMPQEISENSGDAMFRFISWAQSMREGDLAAKQSMVDIEDATLNVMALASTVTTEMTNDPAAKKQIDKLMKQVQDLSGRTEEIAGKMGDVMSQMDNIELAGTKAVGWASVLQRDVNVAIDYYNKIAKMAAQEERTKVRKNLIDQLKSENTRKLVQQQEKYQEMMKQDRKARELAEDNMSLRNRINTVASRINKRLTEETDKKNIQEEAKPLARQLLKMLLEHDFVYRHVLMANKQQRMKAMEAMNAFDQRDGGFDPDRDLNWLIVGQGEDADYDIRDKVWQDLMAIESGLVEYRTAEGQKNISLMDRKAALQKIDEAVTEIWSVIQARETAFVNNKKMMVSELALQAMDDMQGSRFKGEYTGIIGRGIGGVRSGVIYGNMTPEYFFKNLKNGTISRLYNEYHKAENRNGLEVGRAQKKLEQIAEETGYKTWDQKKRYTFNLVKGGTVNLTLGEMMSLYATWQREEENQRATNGPEKSFHLTVGGFYTQQEEQHKILGREVLSQRAHRLTETDMTQIMNAMTPEQIEYVNRVVQYMTNDIGALGNEASMRMYGIKKYNEKWYFPFEIWEGVKSKKSDQGAAGNMENRAAHISASYRRKNNASNALVIRDFTETAAKHIVSMINYNTFAPAIEFMNRVMNEQITEPGEGEDSSTKRNVRAMFGEIYGRDAVKYLDEFNRDVNGGVTRPDANIYDKLLSTFKKSAVAGSASVALQQPLSYLRAAMMVKPKYLVEALNPAYYKGSLEEMEKYSGVAVIKRMGKFDMGLGRSAIDFIMPDAKETTGQKIYNKASDITTIMPEIMDRATWTRMWTACKLEQAALNPGMDQTSDAFLNKVAERFNEVMRKTQVYDSVLVKSKNMRNTNPIVKSFTSFMSEPTLTANVLYDAVINAKEKGGKTVLAKAATTFVMSAILQAIVKGIISAGRNPQDKKTWDENVAYRTGANLLSELNPMNLLPGYNDLMVLFKEGELSDDALSVVGKILEAGKTGIKWIQGKSENPWYRDLEDTAGVISQLFTNIPAKNLMRDMRAIVNYIQKPWAERANSADVLKYQLLDQIHTADNMTGVLNTWLGESGWQTNNSAYYKRIYNADKAGKQEKVSSMINYLTLARGTKESKINEAIRGLAKADTSLKSKEKLEKQKEYGLTKTTDYIISEYKSGNITKQDAMTMYKKENPNVTDKILAEKFDGIDYEKSGGETKYSSYSNYDPLYDAIEANSQTEIKQAVKKLVSLGYDQSSIKSNLTKIYKTDYIQADTKTRGQIQNKLIKAYRELGISENEAIKIMQKWVTDYNKKKTNK